MKKLFGLNQTVTFIIIFASLMFVLGTINSSVNHQEKTYYQIKTSNGEFYLTTRVVESDGCVTFIDEHEKETKVCGTYQIKKI